MLQPKSQQMRKHESQEQSTIKPCSGGIDAMQLENKVLYVFKRGRWNFDSTTNSKNF